jgi:hypothetical protein
MDNVHTIRPKAPFPSTEPLAPWEKAKGIDIADVRVTRVDGQTFILTDVRYEATTVEGDWLTFETYDDVYRVDRETVAYWGLV